MNPGDVVCLARSTVAFWDVVGSTSLYRALGNQTAERLIRVTLARARQSLAKYDGKVVKPTGDGLMLDFSDPDSAARACIDAQRAAQVPTEPGAPALQLRMGFCEGDVVARDGDIFGDCVNVAARLCALARPGFILTTHEIASGLKGELQAKLREFDFAADLKGIGAVEVVQVLWNEQHQHTDIVRVVPPQSLRFSCLELCYCGRVLKFAPEQLPITVGRATSCTIVVPAPNASRQHLKIEYQRGKFVLTDESANGTFVRFGNEPDGHPIYVRNEPFSLIGRGALGLGISPIGDMHAIGFSVS